ncbi:peptidoglycan DD-metalloendopeptidase family protein [Cupriavidus necator]|jgi:lipoprotein NlpD|uniref:Metallopeptidase M23B subfamily n=2 Tax=Cupriavidus necator TaxID=106590 RepID=G0F0I8_CUPNN|nr:MULTISPECIES: peptidoglycan DD-metalloendopeptidase family protein [Cupriavidus]AEI77617.1 metallopeptidase M23B subfamily [Cupriavidus necator N-1]KAI3598305.1 Murein hydrolase activator NlpD [Cupriavidus necator H850]MDX6013848.1 peptidoglycan DD-metalloendopeptidase family protein [Cupriavidus necator]QQX83151.1 peptidoglycan DD-metalloendopeptidase family protein [Cupriavidus necator]QUN27089.1 peptidoglycan DD-metalloendopeptidase family protein [Cupriavidus sp. KK10]
MHNIVKSQYFARAGQLFAASALTALLAACANSPMPAPVVDRTSTSGTTAATLEPAPPGYYRVKRGDTLYRIALENGQSYRDVATWNNLSNVNQIEVGQLLRIVPPGADVNTAPGVATMPVAPGTVQAQPIDQARPAATPVAPAAAASAPAATPAAPAAAAAPVADGAMKLAWPATGQTVGKFDDKGNKGIDIAGKKGDAVLAADDGRVIHVGPLRGYGNLVIIKHNETFLTAYGHNDKVLVAEQSAVRKGQKIAEMGNSDTDRVKLHFEVRKNGKPVDPMRYLPPQ